MKNLNVYLSFSGRCEEALNFYKEAFKGEIVSMQKFGESPMQVGEEDKNKIIHAEFRADGVYLMASDGLSGDVVNGSNISLSLNFSDEEEQEAVFSKLSEGGTITMPLQETFWGAKFGMCTDKFGINWMANWEKRKSGPGDTAGA